MTSVTAVPGEGPHLRRARVPGAGGGPGVDTRAGCLARPLTVSWVRSAPSTWWGRGGSVAVNVAEPEQQQARHLYPHGMYSASVGHILSWGPALSWSAGRAQAAVLSILQAHKSR